MKPPKKTKEVKVWVLQFKHSLGWTLVEVTDSRSYLKSRMDWWKMTRPNFKYRIVPASLNYKPTKK